MRLIAEKLQKDYSVSSTLTSSHPKRKGRASSSEPFRILSSPASYFPPITLLAMADNTSAAYPLAPPDLAQEILDLIQQASHYKQLKK